MPTVNVKYGALESTASNLNAVLGSIDSVQGQIQSIIGEVESVSGSHQGCFGDSVGILQELKQDFANYSTEVASLQSYCTETVKAFRAAEADAANRASALKSVMNNTSIMLTGSTGAYDKYKSDDYIINQKSDIEYE